MSGLPELESYEPVTARAPGRFGAFLTGALFWIMFIVGGGSLAACLVLPAWFEYQGTRQQLEQARQRNAALIRENEARALQIAHHRFDPEYNERYVRREFHIERPDQVTLVLDHPPPATAEPATPASPADQPSRADELARLIERAARDNPLVTMFVLDSTRPAVMLLSGILLIGGLLLLSGPRRT